MSEMGRAELVAVIEGLAGEWSEGRPDRWENDSVPRYLDALAGWLADSDGYYDNQGQDMPDPWTLIADALRAATVYE